MLNEQTTAVYEPLPGWSPDVKPECWLVLDGNSVILPLEGRSDIIWESLPSFTNNDNIQSYSIGVWSGKPLAVVVVDGVGGVEGFKSVPVRSVLSTGNKTTFCLLSHALQIITARKHHQFCGKCGSKNSPVIGEWAMGCSSCEYRVYPRISPCIIVMVAKNDELLLVKHVRHGRSSEVYTVIAGFIEPGESAEEAVRREIMEETGVTVTDIRYQCSQSWPFPHALMLGFHAQYVSGEIVLEEKELSAGGWFKADTLPAIPPVFTISRQLIDCYLQKRAMNATEPMA